MSNEKAVFEDYLRLMFEEINHENINDKDKTFDFVVQEKSPIIPLSDIIDGYDPENIPNINTALSKKTSKNYNTNPSSYNYNSSKNYNTPQNNLHSSLNRLTAQEQEQMPYFSNSRINEKASITYDPSKNIHIGQPRNPYQGIYGSSGGKYIRPRFGGSMSILSPNKITALSKKTSKNYYTNPSSYNYNSSKNYNIRHDIPNYVFSGLTAKDQEQEQGLYYDDVKAGVKKASSVIPFPLSANDAYRNQSIYHKSRAQYPEHTQPLLNSNAKVRRASSVIPSRTLDNYLIDQGNQSIYLDRYSRVKDTIIPTYKEKSTRDYSFSRNDDNNVDHNAYNSRLSQTFRKNSRQLSDRSNPNKINSSSLTNNKPKSLIQQISKQN